MRGIAEPLKEDLFVHHAALTLARQLGSEALLPPSAPEALVPEGYVKPNVVYHLPHYLAMAGEGDRQAQFERVWLAGALLALGDALAAEGYFDRTPILEMVRHLRNAVAHGNRFDIRADELATWPAHTPLHPDDANYRAITPQLTGKEFMFSFMPPGQVVSVLDWTS